MYYRKPQNHKYVMAITGLVCWIILFAISWPVALLVAAVILLNKIQIKSA